MAVELLPDPFVTRPGERFPEGDSVQRNFDAVVALVRDLTTELEALEERVAVLEAAP